MRLVRNMSARPRTQGCCVILPALEKFAVVALDRSVIGFELPADYVLDRSPEELEDAWRQYGLIGAALVYPWRKVGSGENGHHVDPRNVPASDLSLTLNVLGRARGGLLSARAELVLEPGFLSRSLCSDDPRLVRLAIG